MPSIRCNTRALNEQNKRTLRLRLGLQISSRDKSNSAKPLAAARRFLQRRAYKMVARVNRREDVKIVATGDQSLHSKALIPPLSYKLSVRGVAFDNLCVGDFQLENTVP